MIIDSGCSHNVCGLKRVVFSMFVQNATRARWAVPVTVAVLVGLQLGGAGAAFARGGVIVASGIASGNHAYSANGATTLSEAEGEVRNDINARCKSINSRSTGANFTYNVGSNAVSGYGDCVV